MALIITKTYITIINYYNSNRTTILYNRLFANKQLKRFLAHLSVLYIHLPFPRPVYNEANS